MRTLISRLAGAAMFLNIGCNSGASIPNKPVSGTIEGSPFSVAGSTGVWSPDRLRLSVSLDDYAATCGDTSHIGKPYTEVVVSLPAKKLANGTYEVAPALTTDSPNVGVGVSQHTLDNTGKIQSTARMMGSGTVQITSVSNTSVSGGLSVTMDGITVSGTFTAPICP